jgi:hypothetical protein
MPEGKRGREMEQPSELKQAYDEFKVKADALVEEWREKGKPEGKTVGIWLDDEGRGDELGQISGKFYKLMKKVEEILALRGKTVKYGTPAAHDHVRAIEEAEGMKERLETWGRQYLH